MRTHRVASSWLLSPLLVVAAPALACDGEDDAMAMDEDEDVYARDCTTEMRADHYALGLRKVGSAYTVQFVDAMPAPPERGDNTWRVMVTDAGGAGMTDLAIAATPFMPDHQHGSTVQTVVTAGEIPGEYELTPVNLFMPGLWEVTLAMTAEDGTQDDVVFRFCVEP